MTKESLEIHIEEKWNHEDKIAARPVIKNLNPRDDEAFESLIAMRIEDLVVSYKMTEYNKLGNTILLDSKRKNIDLLETKIRETLHTIDTLTNEGIIEEDFTSKVSVDKFKEQVEEMEKDKNHILIPTGIDEIDDETGGGRKGELWIYVAYTSHGKSTMLLNNAHHAVVNCKKNVLFFSAEMGIDEIRQNFHAIHAFKKLGIDDLDTLEIRKGILSLETKKALLSGSEDLADNPKYGKFLCRQVIGNAHVEDLFLSAQEINKETPIDVILIDYLSKLPPIRKRRDVRDEHAETIIHAQKMAKDFNKGQQVLVLSAHQINRQGLTQAMKRTGDWQGVYRSKDMFMTSEAEKSPNVIVSMFDMAEIERSGNDISDRPMYELAMAIIKNRGGRRFPKVPRFNVETHMKASVIRSFQLQNGTGILSVGKEPVEMDDLKEPIKLKPEDDEDLGLDE